MAETNEQFKIGWAQGDITPANPVLIGGLFHARISEGVRDPLTVTVMALEKGGEQTIFVSCDLIKISLPIQQAVRSQLCSEKTEIDPLKVILHATHTHTAPLIAHTANAEHIANGNRGSELDIMPVQEYIDFVVAQIMHTIFEAWNTRTAGGISFGLGTAVTGRNRRWVDHNGKSVMYSPDAQEMQRAEAVDPQGRNVYSLESSAAETFRHIEGYEDHSVQLLATYDTESVLKGLVVNVACPSQESEEDFLISADWWHETRQQLRDQYGEHLFILPQCSAAGDLSPHLLYDHRAHARMLALKNRTAREEIASRIVQAVAEVIPHICNSIEWNPNMKHIVDRVHLQAARLTEKELLYAQKELKRWQVHCEELRSNLEQANTHHSSRWYVDITYAHSRMSHFNKVIERYKAQKESLPVEVHVIRLSSMAFATSPFECYLDFGIQIKVRSPAVQTFLVQLAGAGTYLPSPRSVVGGGYGSTAVSNSVGAEGGQQFVDYTVRMLHSLWH